MEANISTGVTTLPYQRSILMMLLSALKRAEAPGSKFHGQESRYLAFGRDNPLFSRYPGPERVISFPRYGCIPPESGITRSERDIPVPSGLSRERDILFRAGYLEFGLSRSEAGYPKNEISRSGAGYTGRERDNPGPSGLSRKVRFPDERCSVARRTALSRRRVGTRDPPCVCCVRRHA